MAEVIEIIDDGHLDLCAECGSDGKLILCDGKYAHAIFVAHVLGGAMYVIL